LRERHGDSLLTILTVLLMVLMFVLVPLHAAGFVLAQAFAALVVVALVGGALAVSGNKVAFIILSLSLVLQIGVVISRLLQHHFSSHLYLLASAWLMFTITMGWVVARAVFGSGKVNAHRIIGAVFLYLLIALTFASLFVLVGLFVPNAFSGITFDDTPALTGALFYFSIVTLTSTGYGDMFPVHPIARSLCNLETILGQLYPATLLARLVSLEIEARRS
jgi:hypothetical protein